MYSLKHLIFEIFSCGIGLMLGGGGGGGATLNTSKIWQVLSVHLAVCQKCQCDLRISATTKRPTCLERKEEKYIEHI